MLTPASSTHHDSSIHQYYKTPTVTVIIGKGQEQQTFSIHEPLLINSSRYLRGECERISAKGEEKRISLQDYDPRLFNLFVKHLYHGTYNLSHAGLEDEQYNLQAHEYVTHAHAYDLSLVLGAESFRACVVNALEYALIHHKEPIRMETMLQMTRITQWGTLKNHKGSCYAMASLLLEYCVWRYGLANASSKFKHQYIWSSDEKDTLARSQQRQFTAIVQHRTGPLFTNKGNNVINQQRRN